MSSIPQSRDNATPQIPTPPRAGDWSHARFCNANCRDGWRADIECGLIYGPWGIEDEHGELTGTLGWLAGCALYKACAYCRADLEERAGTVAVFPGRPRRLDCQLWNHGASVVYVGRTPNPFPEKAPYWTTYGRTNWNAIKRSGRATRPARRILNTGEY